MGFFFYTINLLEMKKLISICFHYASECNKIFFYSTARSTLRLLGPCYKTGGKEMKNEDSNENKEGTPRVILSDK